MKEENQEILTKICSKCKEEKSFDEFHKCKKNKDGLKLCCKECRKKDSAVYYLKNKEKINKRSNLWKKNNKQKEKEYYKKYYEEHKKEKLEYNSQWRKENRDKMNEYYKKWYDEKRKIDIILILRSKISSSILKALKKNNGTKIGESITQYLPFTIQQLKEHLESQFENWMTWENHGRYSENRRTWHIDHIIPQSKLPFDSMTHPNFKKCWALKNLQPLSAYENLKKSDK